MTLALFTARSTLVTYPRSQVSVYRTIGPLVLVPINILSFDFYTHSYTNCCTEILRSILRAYTEGVYLVTESREGNPCKYHMQGCQGYSFVYFYLKIVAYSYTGEAEKGGYSGGTSLLCHTP